MRKEKQAKKSMKLWQKITLVIASVLLLAGLGLLLFPPVSNFIGQKQADAIVAGFDERADNIAETVTAGDGSAISSLKEARERGCVDDEGFAVDPNADRGGNARVIFQRDIYDLLRDSLAYNEMLLNGQGTPDTVRYENAVFDLADYGVDDGVYAYIAIDAIDMRLPVYLGSDQLTLSCGAAHMYGTSLPVGEGSYNCAIAGHTSYPGRIFFDNLKNLALGDKVRLTTYWDTREYEVVDYKIVTPDVSDDLLIRQDKQLLTLITCIWTGRGQEFDRYIVTCERIG